MAGLVPHQVGNAEPAPPEPTITHDDEGNVTLLGAEAGETLSEPSDTDPVAAATTYLDQNDDQLGLAPGSRLVESGINELPEGGGSVTFQQHFDDVPVLGGQVVVRLDENLAVLSLVSNVTSSDLNASTDPTIGANSAGDIAIDAVSEQFTDTAGNASLEAEATLYVFDPSLGQSAMDPTEPAPPALVWNVEVTEPVAHTEFEVMIDATTGLVIGLVDLTEGIAPMKICDRANTPPAPGVKDRDEHCETIRLSGDPADGHSDAVNTAYGLLDQTYEYFLESFGRESYDGENAQIEMAVRFCNNELCGTPGFVNGAGVIHLMDGIEKSHDVIGHEFTHLVISKNGRGGLRYSRESGAINESLADFFGEMIEQAYGGDPNWLINEDQPGFGAMRSMADPPMFANPDRVGSPLYHLPTNAFDSFGNHNNSGINNKAAYLIVEGGQFNGYQIEGIGNAKAAAVYYEMLTMLATPMMTFEDLSVALPQACNNLVDRENNTYGLTANDCVSVSAAVAATEMNASVSGNQPADAKCDVGAPIDLFHDGAELGMTNWVVSGNAPTQWEVSNANPRSGGSAFHVANPAQPTQPGVSYLRTRAPISIPEGASPFLWFNHTFGFQNYFHVGLDGGVVEYSTDGQNWVDLDSLIVNNHYNGVISSEHTNNPFAGRPVFAELLRQYQPTRADLSSLAGQDVYLRFGFATGTPGPAVPLRTDTLGWFIDDVSIYECSEGQTGQASNVAASGTASQSSVSHGGVPQRAIDGRTNGQWSARSITSTAREEHAYWDLALPQPVYIDRIQIWNRVDCCPKRLSDFWVFTSNTPFSTTDPDQLALDPNVVAHRIGSAPSPSTSVEINSSARYVRVQLDGTGILSLAEVEVLANGLHNVGPAGSATQSSVSHGGVPQRAIDGRTSGQWSARSITATAREERPYWDLALPQPVYIDRIQIWNRVDCCPNRLSDFWVFSSSSPFTSTDPEAVAADPNVTARRFQHTAVPSVTARIGSSAQYVRIQLNNTDILSLAEVEVLSPEKFVNIAPEGTASQSSTGWGGGAERAIDGNTDGSWRSGSVTHTRRDNDPPSHWDLEFDEPVAAEFLTVWNRTDGCCSGRLSDFWVFTTETEFTSTNPETLASDSQVQAFRITEPPSPQTLIDLAAGSQVRRVRVQLAEPGWLSLAEVEVFASTTPSGTG